MVDNFFDFIGNNNDGHWRTRSISTISGTPIPSADFLTIQQGNLQPSGQGNWSLKGFRSNIRYAERPEKEQLIAVQAPLGRSEATYAALIPIRKTAAWWDLTQEERRAIFEKKSHHTEIGLRYLPAIARQLYHSRDIGEPFDFLTWFEFAPEHEAQFEALLAALRQSEEWLYVDREIDIRLEKV